MIFYKINITNNNKPMLKHGILITKAKVEGIQPPYNNDIYWSIRSAHTHLLFRNIYYMHISKLTSLSYH